MDESRRLTTCCLSLLLAAAAGAAIHQESSDAGDPSNPQATQTAGVVSLDAIVGSLGAGDAVDSYCVTVVDPAAFKATTSSADIATAMAAFDSRLFLLSTGGLGLLGNDDSPNGSLGSLLTDPAQFPGTLESSPSPLQAQTEVILAIGAYPNEPLDGTGQALVDLDGSGFLSLVGANPAAGAYASWNGSSAPGDYRIELRGAAPCGARLVFVTSETGNGNLATWTSSSALSGLAGADQVCQTLASAADLPSPDRFIAWMSDGTDDAYCRVLGLSGKKASNCGQGALPASGPWIRTDGRPFVFNVTDLTMMPALILTAPSIDENGHDVGNGSATLTFTGTSYDGTVNVRTCSNGTSASSSLEMDSGNIYGTSGYWTDGFSRACSGLGRLFCMQTGSGLPMQPESPTSAPIRTAFLTSVYGPGNLSGWPLIAGSGKTRLDAGDAICKTLATDAELREPDSFKAWLSSSTADAKDRFLYDGPWHLTDGRLLARTLDDLIGGSLLRTGLIVDEHGQLVDWLYTIYTGTLDTGRKASQTCDSWSSSAADGLWGLPGFVDGSFTGSGIDPCSEERRLYCFSDDSLRLFADGFESGDTLAW